MQARQSRYAPIERTTGPIEPWRVAALLVLGLLAATPAPADAGRLFRYRDERGVVHIDTTLPPGQAQGRYEVLDQRTLRVLRVVEAPPTPTELQARAKQHQETMLAEAAARKAFEDKRAEETERSLRDRMLMQTYASEADLTRMRDAKLENLDLILRATENTIGHLKRNLQRSDQLIAEHKAAGRQPPAALVQARAQTAADLADQEKAALRTRAEQEQMRARFRDDLDRYRRLTGSLQTATP